MSTTPRAPIQIFDSNLNFVAEVDTYASLTHTRGWNAPGPFQIEINWNVHDDTGTIFYAQLFQVGGYITIDNDSRKCGLILAIEKPIDQGGKGSQNIKVSGFEPTILFNRRMIDVPSGSDFYTLNSNAETVIKTVISDQAGPTATNMKRKMPLLSIATNQGRGDNYLLSVAYTELLGELTNCSVATRLGFFIELDRANKRIILDCELGTDLTAGNNPAAIFSTNYDTLKSANLKTSLEQFKNLATVTGQGTGQLRPVLDVYTAPEPTGVDRFETYVNANNLLTTPDLTAKGSQTLDSFSYTKQLDAEILASSPLVYGQDYNLGDFVTVAAYDFSENVQITAIQESWQPLQYDLVPTFEKAPPTISGQMAISSKNLGSQVSNLGFPSSGSNANGKWTKFPGGKMMQSGTVTVTTNTTFSALFFASSDTVVTFPVQFVTIDSVMVTLQATSNAGTSSVGSAFLRNASGTSPVSLTGCAVNVWTSNNAQTYTVYWEAWGTWQ